MGYETIINSARDKTLQVTPYYVREKSKEEQEYDQNAERVHQEDEKHAQLVNQYNEKIKACEEKANHLQHMIDSNFNSVFNTARTHQRNLLLSEIDQTRQLLEMENMKYDEKTADREFQSNNTWDNEDENFKDQNRAEHENLSKKLDTLLAGNTYLQENRVQFDFDEWNYDPEDFLRSKNAQRTLEQAVQHHFDLGANKNIPDYLNIFVEDPSLNFEKMVTGEKSEPGYQQKTAKDVAAEQNHKDLTNIFSTQNPMEHPGFLDAVYTKLNIIMDLDAIDKMTADHYEDKDLFANPYANPFFTDRGRNSALADDKTLAENANQLVNLYELAKNADVFIQKLREIPSIGSEDERKKQDFERGEIIERMKMLKSQKGFMLDEIQRLEAMSNPYATFFDLNSLETLKELSDLYTQKEKDVDFENQNDRDFLALCKNCHERWINRTILELEAVEDLVTECSIREGNDPNVKLSEVKMVIKDKKDPNKTQVIDYDRNRAQAALLEDQDVSIFFERKDPAEEEPEKVSLDVKNDGKMSWATYKVQIDCDCQSLDLKALPKKPPKYKEFFNWIRKVIFRTTGDPEVEEYYAAKAKFEEATRKAKAFVENKAQAEATDKKQDELFEKADSADKELELQKLLKQEEERRKEWERLVAEEKKYHDIFEKLKKGPIGEGDQIWENTPEEEKNKLIADAKEYYRMQQLWDTASESSRQRSRITDLRSSKMLERRTVKKAEEKITKRNTIKAEIKHQVKEYTAVLFQQRETFENAGFSADVQDILLGKSASGIDLSKLCTDDLDNCINAINNDLKKFGDETEWSEYALYTHGNEILNNSKIEGNQYTEAINYFKGKSKIEVFDGLCKETRADNLKDNAHIENLAERQTPEQIAEAKKKDNKITALATKRKSSLQKAILLHAKQRIEEIRALYPEAKKNDAERLLSNSQITSENVRCGLNTLVDEMVDRIFTDPRYYNSSMGYSRNIKNLNSLGKNMVETYRNFQKHLGVGNWGSFIPKEKRNSLKEVFSDFAKQVRVDFNISEDDAKKMLTEKAGKNAYINVKAAEKAFTNYPQFKTDPRFANLHTVLFVDPLANLDQKTKSANAKDQTSL